MRKFVLLLLLFTLVKGLVWSLVTPPFQAPDEQNHFAYVQFVAEKGHRSVPWGESNTSLELDATLKLIKFSQTGDHPFYIPEFTKGGKGAHETEVLNLPQQSRRQFIKLAAGSANPPLYYLGGAFFYKIFENGSIFSRVYAIRFFSVLLGIATVYFAYRTIKLFAPGNKNLQLIIPTVLSLHPSFTFTTSTITIDALTILWTSILVFVWGMIVKKELNWTLAVAALAVSIASVLVREVLTISLIITPILLILKLRIKKEIKIFSVGGLILLIILIIQSNFFDQLLKNSSVGGISGQFGNHVKQFNFLTGEFSQGRVIYSLIAYFSNFAKDFNSNIFSWYWGIFGWLEVQLPINIYRILKLTTIVSFLGVVYFFFKGYKTKLFLKRKDLCFFLATFVIIAFPVFLFDYQKFVTEPGPFGFQGRYLLPGIVPQITIFVIGLVNWVPLGKLNKVYIALLLFFFTVNLISMWQIVNFFYQPNNIPGLIERMSQYKPIVFKDRFIVFWFLLYLLSIFVFCFFTFKKVIKTKADE